MRLLFTYLMGMTILHLGHWYRRPRCPVGLSVCGSGTNCERCTWKVGIRAYYPVGQRHWGECPEISAWDCSTGREVELGFRSIEGLYGHMRSQGGLRNPGLLLLVMWCTNYPSQPPVTSSKLCSSNTCSSNKWCSQRVLIPISCFKSS